MLASASRHASFGVRAALSSLLFATALAAAASGGGCTLLVGSQLSEKPSGGAGGGGGQGGDGGASSASPNSSATGGAPCKPDTADCNGFLSDGCEAKLSTDSKNCGACKKACDNDEHCKEGKCE